MLTCSCTILWTMNPFTQRKHSLFVYLLKINRLVLLFCSFHFVCFFKIFCGFVLTCSYKRLSRILSGITSIVTAQYDLEENDVEKEHFDVLQPPLFKLYPKGRKNSPITYTGKLIFHLFVRYLLLCLASLSSILFLFSFLLLLLLFVVFRKRTRQKTKTLLTRDNNRARSRGLST